MCRCLTHSRRHHRRPCRQKSIVRCTHKHARNNVLLLFFYYYYHHQSGDFYPRDLTGSVVVAVFPSAAAVQCAELKSREVRACIPIMLIAAAAITTTNRIRRTTQTECDGFYLKRCVIFFTQYI